MEILENTDELIAEELGRAQTPATKRKIAKSLMGKDNPAYKTGRRSYRRIAGAKDAKVHIHHKNGNSDDNRPSNLEKFPAKGPGRAAHERKHLRYKNFSKSGGRKTPPRGYRAKELKK